MNIPEPHTASQLFDYLHIAFGVGHYDAVVPGGDPWYQVRMKEIGKLKRMLAARKVEIKSCYIAGEYCRQHNITIEETGGIFMHIGPAMREWRAGVIQLEREQWELRVQNAISEAMERGDTDFADRLFRSDKAAQEQMLGVRR